MLLSYNELKAEVQNKVLSPVPDERVNASSIDVTLGPALLLEKRPTSATGGKLLFLRDRTPMVHVEYPHLSECTHGYVLKPGQFVLAQTAETFNMPLDMSGEFRMKSSAARMGLSHALAVWIDPGWTGSVLTLELHNVTQHQHIVLQLGDPIGQVIFHRHAPVPEAASYKARGAYNHDSGPSASKPVVSAYRFLQSKPAGDS